MTWPADRKAVDRDGKWLDPWLGELQKLRPLLAYTPAQFAALQQLIAAYIASQQDDGETDPGTIIDLALPIDNEPLPDEDWLIEYKNSANAGRRVPISTLLALSPTNKLISTTALTGNASADIVIPSGYRDVEVRMNNMSSTSTGTQTIAFSEDGGSTFLTQRFNIITDTFDQSGSSTAATLSVTTGLSASTIVSCSTLIRDYLSLTAKFTRDDGLYFSGASTVAWAGNRYMDGSVAPINLVQIATSAGTFDSGTVDLIGIP